MQVRILVGGHPLIAQDDCHARCQDFAFGACHSYPSAVKVVDQYAVKTQKRLGKCNGYGGKQVAARTLKGLMSLSFEHEDNIARRKAGLE